MNRTQRLVVACALAGVHFVVSITLVVFTFGYAMADFDAATGPRLSHRLANGIETILHFPVVTAFLAAHARLPGIWAYAVFALNSLVWGAAAYALISFFSRRTRPREA